MSLATRAPMWSVGADHVAIDSYSSTVSLSATSVDGQMWALVSGSAGVEQPIRAAAVTDGVELPLPVDSIVAFTPQELSNHGTRIRPDRIVGRNSYPVVSYQGTLASMRVTDKGQVTIPKELRDRFGIGAGSEVEFVDADGELVVRKVETGERRGDRVAARLRGRGDVPVTTDELMALTRGE